MLLLSIVVGSPTSLLTRAHHPSQGNDDAPIISGTNRIFHNVPILLRGSHNLLNPPKRTGWVSNNLVLCIFVCIAR